MMRKDKGAIRSRMSSFTDAFLGGAVQKPRRKPVAEPHSQPNVYGQINPSSVKGKSR